MGEHGNYGKSAVEFAADYDGRTVGNGYGYSGDYVNGAMADSWEMANRDMGDGMAWSVEEDGEDDGLEVSLTVRAYASLVARAKVGDRHTRMADEYGPCTLPCCS